MNRKQIAEALGVSEKSVSRYVASGRLPDRRVKGALDVDPADVERLKAELEAPIIADPFAITDAPATRSEPDAGALLNHSLVRCPVPACRALRSGPFARILGGCCFSCC